MSRRLRRRHPIRRLLVEQRAALLAVVLLGLVVAWIYGRFLGSPRTFFIGDLVNLFGPLRHQWASALRVGELPLWESAIFAGTPVVADPQAATFYPGTLIHLLVSYPLSELISFLAHLLLGGAGLLWWMRRRGQAWLPALFSATGFVSSGFFVTHLVHPNFIHTAAWLPWVAGGLERWLATARPRYAALAALATGLALLAGGLQLAYYGFCALFVLCGVWTFTARSATNTEPLEALAWWRQRSLRLAGALAALALGFGLAAVQMLPTLEFSALSVRAEGVTLALARSYGLTERGLCQLLSPHCVGLPGLASFQGGSDFYESYGYLGCLSLPLALTALARRRPERWVLGAVVALALLAGLGPQAPVDLQAWFYHHLPGFDRFRAHGRLLFLALLGLTLLAGLGLGDLLTGGAASPERLPSEQHRIRQRARWVFCLAAALALLFSVALARGLVIDQSRWPSATAKLATRSALLTAGTLCAALVLVVIGWRWRRSGRLAILGAGLLALHLVDVTSAARRLVAHRHPPAGVDTARRVHRLPPEILADVRDGQRLLFAPGSFFMLQNLGMIHDFDNLRAYGPMMLRRTYDLLEHAQRGRFPRWRRLPVDQNNIMVGHYRSPVLRMFGVRRVVSHNRPRVRASGYPPLRFRSRRLPAALPRAFVVHATELVRDPRQRSRRLQRFDPARLALVETPAAMLDPGADSKASPGIATVRLTRSKAGGHLTLRTVAAAEGLLVIAESWYPGWRARVDGRLVRVHRVNHGLMGVRLPAGRHRVTLDFEPASLRRGAWLSALSLLFVLGGLFGAFWWNRRAPAVVTSPEASSPRERESKRESESEGGDHDDSRRPAASN